MMPRQMSIGLEVLPKPSSQTTSFPSELIGVGQQIVVDSASFHTGSFIIQVPRERTWSEVIEEIMREYSEAWERLAKL